MRMCMKQVVLGAVLSLSAVSLSAGCSKKTEEIQITKETATPVQTEAPTQTETPMPTPDPSISVTSSDGNIQIDLPDDTWRSLEEKEGKYVFSSPDSGSMTITRNTEVSGIRLPRSKETVLDYLEDMGDDVSEMEVEEYVLTDVGTDSLETVTYTVKNLKEGMHPYITSYIILHTDELYDVTALAEKDDEALLKRLQKSVVSLQVLHEDHPASKVTPASTAAPTPAATKAAQTATPTQIVTAAPEDQSQDLVATQDIPQEIARTGETITLYNVDTNAQTIIYGLSNGEWVDDLGVGHQAEGAGQWSDGNGNMYAVDPVMQENGDAEARMTLYRSDGSGSVDITQSPEGIWYDDQGVSYQAEGAGQWSDENGDMYAAGQ